jgi:FdrA protein
LVEAIHAACALAKAAGREIIFIASVCGTEADPQVLSRQREQLAAAGVALASSNAAASRLAAAVIHHLQTAR